MYVGGQLQAYPLTWSVQDPPFKQGLLEHSSISMRQINQIRTIKKSLEKRKITLACFQPTSLNVRLEVKGRLIGVRSNTFHVFDRPSKAIILKVIESVLDLWKGRVTNVSKILLYLRFILRENSFYLLLFLSSKT